MVKKGIAIGGAVLLLLGLLFGRDGASYVATALGGFRDSVHDSIPVAFEIERAKRMINELDPEVHRNMHLIAKEEVEVTNLREQIGVAERQLAKGKADIERLTRDLKQGGSEFVYAGKSYTEKQVENDLARRFEQYKVKAATLEKLQQVLTARERGLSAGREKLKAMQASKQQLEVDVANMEARLEMVRVAQSTSDFNFDDSHLARTRDLVKAIGARIDVAEKLVNADTSYPGQIELDETENTNITEQITQYFEMSDSHEAETVVKLDNAKH
jgi:chromosome segregation ATPase